MALLIRAAAPRLRGLGLLSLLPIAAMLADYAENAVIWTILRAYPERLEGMAATAGILTMAKTALTQASLGLILLFALGALVARLRRSRNGGATAGTRAS